MERSGSDGGMPVHVQVMSGPPLGSRQVIREETLQPVGPTELIVDAPPGRIEILTWRATASAVARIDIERGQPEVRVVVPHPDSPGSLELNLDPAPPAVARCYLAPGRALTGPEEVECSRTIRLEYLPRGTHDFVVAMEDGSVTMHPIRVTSDTICRYSLDPSSPLSEAPAGECGERHDDIVAPPQDERLNQRDIACDPYAGPERSAWDVLRYGFDFLLGGQWNDVPVDHVAVGMALTGDFALTDYLLAGLRFAYLTGGDRGVDADGDFVKDNDADNVHALLFTGGPRLRLGENDYRDGLTAFELDVGVGAVAMVAGNASSGPLLEGGIRILRGPAHLGLRFEQGIGAAAEYRALLAGAGFDFGGLPTENFVPDGCNDPPPRNDTRFSHSFRGELLVGSFAFHGRGGYGPPGIALQFALPIVWTLQFAARTDAVYYPGYPGDGVVQYGVSGGLRIQPFERGRRLFLSVLGGYSVSLGTMPAAFDNGPFLDVGASYELTDRSFDEGVYAGVRTRFGLTSDNEDLRVVFLTLALGFDSGPRGDD